MRTAIMFIVFGLITIANGCANSALRAPDLHFHSSVDADNFCAKVDMGYTIGYRTEQPNPWSDQLFCLSAKGLFIITATRDGRDVQISNNNWTESSVQDVIWMARLDRRDSHVALSDRLVNSCPDRSEPLAIIPRMGPVYATGATIDVGDRLCLMGDELVLYRDDGKSADSPPSGTFHEVIRWNGFTPTNANF